MSPCSRRRHYSPSFTELLVQVKWLLAVLSLLAELFLLSVEVIVDNQQSTALEFVLRNNPSVTADTDS